MPEYYCHKCAGRCTKLERYDQQVRCGRCHEGFIEELGADTAHPRAPAGPNPLPSLPMSENPFGAFPGSPFNRLFPQIFRHRDLNTRPVQTDETVSTTTAATQESSAGNAAETQQRPMERSENGQQPEDPMMRLFNQFLGDMVTQMDTTGGVSRMVIRIGTGDGGLFDIRGNPNDYAGGEDGLDNVLTAILNQFDAAQEQMRALRPEDIGRLPMAKVTQKHVDNTTQCTTCMETFKLDEVVAKLNCEHIFHPDCLKPWLMRNNTCPICRKVIDPNEWSKPKDVDELD